MARRVYLHIGTPKSGTTYLQSLLFAHRDTLRARGVLYPGARPFDQNRASIDVRHGRHLPDAKGGRVWPGFLQEVGGYEGDAVLSNEWYVEADDEQARALIEQLGNERVHVVLTTRNFVRLVPAAWQESLKVGRGHSLPDFVTALDSGKGKWAWDVLDPAVVARRWADLVGASRVHVVPVPEDPTPRDLLWQQFARTVGFDATGLDPEQQARNESLSVPAARLLQEYGPSLRSEVDRHDSSWQAPFRWLRLGVAHRILADLPGDPIGVDDELRQRLLERNDRTVRALRELGCAVSGDLDDLLPGTNRTGARSPEEVTDAELVEAARALSVGLLRTQLQAAPRRRRKRGAGEASDPGGDQGGGATRTAGSLQRLARGLQHAGATARARTRTGRRSLSHRLAVRGRTRRVTFMVPFAYGMGGIPRTVFTVANALAARNYEVSVVTLVRNEEQPYFALDPRIDLVPLADRYDPTLPGGERPRPRRDPDAPRRSRRLDRKPSVLVEGAHTAFSALVDEALKAYLSERKPGVIVSTRPEFTLAATKWSDPASLVVHQEHLSFVGRARALRTGARDLALRAGVPRPVDAFLTLTDADLERWQQFVGDSVTRWGVIPNATPFRVGEPAPLTSKVVLAAGRFTRQKGFDRLVAAYQPLAESHPNWQLHIYGDGDLMPQLTEQVAATAAGDRIQLRGFTAEFEQVLEQASIYAMSSRFEGLPMVLLEAFSKGVPPVSFDCPEGPRQLIDPGVNGLLVPAGDVPALTSALAKLMDDEDLRRQLGQGAMESARGYQVGPVVDQWVSLFEELDHRRRDG